MAKLTQAQRAKLEKLNQDLEEASKASTLALGKWTDGGDPSAETDYYSAFDVFNDALDARDAYLEKISPAHKPRRHPPGIISICNLHDI